MLLLSNAFVSLKQAILRRVVHMHQAKFPRVEPFVFEKPRAAANLDDDLLTPSDIPICVQFPTDFEIETSPTTYAMENGDSPSVSSPASAFSPSLFSHRNVSTSTTLTMPSPSLWLKGCDLDTDNQQDDMHEMAEEFAAFQPGARDSQIQDQADFISHTPEVEARRSGVRWGCIDGPSPSEMEIGVVVPASGPATEATFFIFGYDVVYFTPLVKYLAEKSGRRRWDNIVLVNKVYPGTVHDQESFSDWMKWSMCRKASEDLVLYAF